MDGLCVPECDGLCIAHKAVHRPWEGHTPVCRLLPGQDEHLYTVCLVSGKSPSISLDTCALLVKPSSVFMDLTRHRPLVYERYKPQRSWGTRGTATLLGTLPGDLWQENFLPGSSAQSLSPAKSWGSLWAQIFGQMEMCYYPAGI